MAYFSNGTEGEILDRQCDACPLADDAPCPILLVQLEYNYKQCEDGQETLREAMNHLIDEKGRCKMKPLIEAATGEGTPMDGPVSVMPSMREWAIKQGLQVQ